MHTPQVEGGHDEEGKGEPREATVAAQPRPRPTIKEEDQQHNAITKRMGTWRKSALVKQGLLTAA